MQWLLALYWCRVSNWAVTTGAVYGRQNLWSKQLLKRDDCGWCRAGLEILVDLPMWPLVGQQQDETRHPLPKLSMHAHKSGWSPSNCFALPTKNSSIGTCKNVLFFGRGRRLAGQTSQAQGRHTNSRLVALSAPWGQTLFAYYCEHTLMLCRLNLLIFLFNLQTLWLAKCQKQCMSSTRRRSHYHAWSMYPSEVIESRARRIH